MRYRVLACLLATSCSYAFVRPPPSDHPTAPDDCTESRVPPVIDTVLTGVAALTLLFAIPRCTNPTSSVKQNGPIDGCGIDAWVGLAMTGVLGAATAVSAVHGYRATKSCRTRRENERSTTPAD